MPQTLKGKRLSVDTVIEMMRVYLSWLSLGLMLTVCLGVGACGSKQAFKPTQPDAKPVQKAQPADETAGQDQVVSADPVSAEKSDDDATLNRCEPTFADHSLSGLRMGGSERVVSVTDLDGDHKAEVASYSKSEGGGSINVYKQNAEGQYTVLTQLTSLMDTQGINRQLVGDDVKVFTGYFSKKSKDSKVKDLLVFLKNSTDQQMHVLRWDLVASSYSSTAVYSAIKSSDASKNIHAEIFPVSSDANNVFKPVLAGNFLGGNYDGILFHAVNGADVQCLGQKAAEDCGDGAANLFVLQFSKEGSPEKFSAPYLVADGSKRNYRLAAGNLVLAEPRKGLDLIAQRQCRTDITQQIDNGCDEPGMTALGGAGGARAYINGSTVSKSSVEFVMFPAVDDFEGFNVHGSKYITTYEGGKPKKVHTLELGDADRDGLDDLFIIFQGDPGSQETGKKALLCILYNLGDGFSVDFDDPKKGDCDLKKDNIAFQAEPFVADLNGDGTSDVLFQDSSGGLTALSLSCQDGADETEGLGSGGAAEDSKF